MPQRRPPCGLPEESAARGAGRTGAPLRPGDRARQRGRLLAAVRVLAGLVLLSLLGWKVDWGAVKAVLAGVAAVPVIAAVVVGALNVAVIGVRWRILLAALGVHIRWRTAVSAMWQGWFFSQFLPSQIGGDVYRTYLVGVETSQGLLVATSVLVDRFLGMIALLLFCALGAAASPSLSRTRATTVSLVLLGVLVTAAAVVLFAFPAARLPSSPSPEARPTFRGRLWRVLSRLQDAARSYRKARAALLAAAGVSVLAQLVAIAWAYLAFAAVRHPISWGDAAAVMNLGTLVGMVPISISGLGLQEGTWVGLASAAGVPQEGALGAALVFRAIRVGMGVVGGGIYLLQRRPVSVRAAPEPPPDPSLPGGSG